MSDHPNYMVAWDEIACQRGHEFHESRRVQVVLGGPHGYQDYASVPKKLARHFEMEIWDPQIYPVDGGPYCPAHDAVSATIVSHRIWEPRETVLALHMLTEAGPEAWMLDMGAQLGWFTLLAASCGVMTLAYEADPENLRLLETSLAANGWVGRVGTIPGRIGPETSPLDPLYRIALAKLDLEGAEDEAIRVLWPSIEAGLVDHMLIEISPVFASYYPELVVKLVDAGYRAYTLPPRQRPPISLIDPACLEPYRIDTLTRGVLAKLVAGWHQEDVFFVREGVAW